MQSSFRDLSCVNRVDCNTEHDMLNPMLSETAFTREFIMTLGEQRWRSGESTRLPPMWPSSIPGLGVICGLSLSLVFFLAPRGFSLVTLVFPSMKTNISKFQFDLGRGPRVYQLCSCYVFTLCLNKVD